tara:strand:- start:174 stop:782 length:609 start_codon:yes stop_codon:yes gene_type:complete
MLKYNYIIGFILITFIFFIHSCKNVELDKSILENQNHSVVKLVTNKGDIFIELYNESSPITVENFLNYVKSDFYDGTIFHRVIDGFMIQGGGFDVDMVQKDTLEPIKNEAINGLKNKRGTVAMARTQIVDSATSQFFINVYDNHFLDHLSINPQQYGYAVFGNVIEGMTVVDLIKSSSTEVRSPYSDVPKESIIIEDVVVIQ